MHTKFMTGLLIGGAALVGGSSAAVAATAATTEYCPYLDIALTGGWYSAFNANSAYSLSSLNGAVVNPNGEIVRVNPKYKFAGAVALNYQTDCCYNWGATYVWHKNHSNRTTAGPNAAVILNPLPAVLPSYAASAASDYHYRHDFGNVEVGSTICVVADYLSINPKIGVSYGRFKNHQKTSYAPAIAAAFGGGNAVVDEQSTFSGFGPSIGADVNYAFCEGLSLLGNIRYSAVVGTLKGHYALTTGPAMAVLQATQSFHSKRHFASIIQSELGLGYGFDMGGYCGNLSAGYQLTKGFNTHERLLHSGTNTARFSENILDSGDHGPFVRLTMRFGM